MSRRRILHLLNIMGRLAGGGRQLAALYNSLVAFWALDEASGARADGIGSNTLTDNNTVGSTTGLVYPLAAQFVRANSEYLSIANNAALRVSGSSFFLGRWVKFTSLTNYMVIAGKWATDPNGEYLLDTGAGGASARFTFRVAPDGASHKAIAATTFGLPVINTWYFVLSWHNTIAQTINIQINGGAVDSVAYTGTANNGSNPFQIGKDHTVNNYFDGLGGPVFLGKGYAPTAADGLALYNAGAGLTLAEMAVT